MRNLIIDGAAGGETIYRCPADFSYEKPMTY
jgi:hypothetical protein